MKAILFIFLCSFSLFGKPLIFNMDKEREKQIILPEDMYCFGYSSVEFHSRGESLSLGYIESYCSISSPDSSKLKKENHQVVENTFLFKDVVVYFSYFMILVLAGLILYKVFYRKK